MKLLKNIFFKLRLVNLVKRINRFFVLNETEQAISEIASKSKKLKNSKNQFKIIEKILKLSKKYFKIFFKDPLYLFNHAIILQNFSRNPNDGFKMFEDYEKIKQNWVKENQLNYLDQDFIPYQQLTGSLGNHLTLFFLLINQKIFSKNSTKLNVLLETNSKFTNPTLVNYFKKDLNIIKSDDFYNKLKFIYELKKIPIEFTLPFKNTHYPWFATINFIRQELIKNEYKNKNYFFKLNENDEERGTKILRDLGLPNGRWFVTLHVREGIGNELFNSSPLTYLKAVKTIYDNGGYVIRVGDRKMKRLSNITGLIDYPFTNFKSDFMDVFLAAKNEFCIGTSSGYWSLPIFFKKPVILTNYIPHLDYFMLDNKSIFLPKKIINKTNNKLINFKESFSFPLGYMCTNVQLLKNNIREIDNSDEEINLAIKEMLVIQNKIDNKNIKNQLLEKNILLKNILKEKTLNLYDLNLNPFGYFSSSISVD